MPPTACTVIVTGLVPPTTAVSDLIWMFASAGDASTRGPWELPPSPTIAIAAATRRGYRRGACADREPLRASPPEPPVRRSDRVDQAVMRELVPLRARAKLGVDDVPPLELVEGLREALPVLDVDGAAGADRGDEVLLEPRAQTPFAHAPGGRGGMHRLVVELPEHGVDVAEGLDIRLGDDRGVARQALPEAAADDLQLHRLDEAAADVTARAHAHRQQSVDETGGDARRERATRSLERPFDGGERLAPVERLEEEPRLEALR